MLRPLQTRSAGMPHADPMRPHGQTHHALHHGVFGVLPDRGHRAGAVDFEFEVSMDREEIIRMALAAGIYHEYDSEGQWDGLTNEALVGKDWLSSKEHKLDRIVEILSPFAALVAAAAKAEEREACAKVCDDLERANLYGVKECAAALRARSNT